MCKLFIVVISALFSCLTQAQSHFGLKAGGNLTTLRGNSGLQSATRVGFHAGGFAAINLTGGLYVVPELQYSLQGNKQANAKLNLSYINMPWMLQYHSDGGFYAEVGPQAGLLLRARLRGTTDNEDVAARFSSLDVSGCIGIGFKEVHGFGIGARYNLGLSNIAADNLAPVKNGVLQLSLICAFGKNGAQSRSKNY